MKKTRMKWEFFLFSLQYTECKILFLYIRCIFQIFVSFQAVIFLQTQIVKMLYKVHVDVLHQNKSWNLMIMHRQPEWNWKFAHKKKTCFCTLENSQHFMTRHMWECLNIPVTGILHVFSHLSAGRCFYVPCAYCLPAKRSAGGLGTRMFNANQMLWIKFREKEVDLELDSRKRYPNFSVFVDLVWIVQSGGVRSLFNIFISLIN